MRAVVSRVSESRVRVDGDTVGQIGRGLLVYVGVIAGDTASDVAWMARKLTTLRIFDEAEPGKMNESVADVGGGLLLISNFTLSARTKKGTRPSFTDAAEPAEAERLFDRVAEACRAVVPTETGRFGASMRIENVADGPVTIWLDSRA